MAYEFKNLSPFTFERVVQAIAGAVIGPGTTTFGAGPDGGREATFEGLTGYPTTAAAWDGYIVFQAKFLERTKSTSSDQKWVLKQLREELQKFSKDKDRRKPDYYVFVTNVVLTAVPEVGGKDQASALLNEFKQSHGVRDWAIWDYDELTKFLDIHQGISRKFAHFLSAGDVLSEIIEEIGHRKDEVLTALTKFLAKELINDVYVNLEQAGHSPQEDTLLAKVFVDVPYSEEQLVEPAESPLPQVVRSFIASASSSSELEISKGGLGARVVLLGGPGQGKSTVTQFLCQLYRTALLSRRPPQTLSPETQEAVAAFTAQCAAADIDLPGAKRFPLRVILRDYASALSADPNLSLISYLANRVQVRTGHAMRVDDLLRFASAHPLFVCLDGLDEVPASANRAEVLKKINELWIDLAASEVDVVVMATTRPQGYSEDFSNRFYKHVWLAPLRQDEALNYGRRLARVRYFHQQDRRDRVITRLEHAVSAPATVRMMRTPLQITIMAWLVDQSGSLPQDRWRLFSEYYGVMYRRELEKDTSASQVLRDLRNEIDAIHHQAGLALQVRSESAGGTQARLTREEFMVLVRGALADVGYGEPRLSDIARDIIGMAQERLVFLVGPEDGTVGFEIRSLQEFMASEALMTGEEHQVKSRLELIATRESWRNVFLFAAARCFARDPQYKEFIYTLTQYLNDPSARAGSILRLGSQLATKILADGFVRSNPKFSRLFCSSAIESCVLPDRGSLVVLAACCDENTADIFRTYLRENLKPESQTRRGSWWLLVEITRAGHKWASDLLNEEWRRASLFEKRTALANRQTMPAVLANKLEPLLFEQDIGAMASMLHTPRSIAKPTLWFEHLGDALQSNAPRKQISASVGPLGISIVLNAMQSSAPEWARVFPDILPVTSDASWRVLSGMADFHKKPTLETLAAVVEAVKGSEKSVRRFLNVGWSFLDWCSRACLEAAVAGDPAHLANAIRNGEMGNVADWRKAEARWVHYGITLADLEFTPTRGLPFDRTIASVGAPLSAGRLERLRGTGLHTNDLMSSVRRLPEGHPSREALVRALIYRLGLEAREVSLIRLVSATNLLSLFNEGTPALRDLSAELLNGLFRLALKNKDWRECVFALSDRRTGPAYYFGNPALAFVGLDELVEKFGTSRFLNLAAVAATTTLTRSKFDVGDYPQFENETDPLRRASALAVEISYGALSKKRRPALVAEVIAGASGPDELIREALAMRIADGDAGIELALDLWEGGYRDAWTYLSIVNVIGDGPSGLASAGAWGSLGLPSHMTPLVHVS